MDPLSGCHPTCSSVPGPRSPVPWVDSLQVATGAAPVSTRLGNNPRELALQRGIFGEKKLQVGGRHAWGWRGGRECGVQRASPLPLESHRRTKAAPGLGGSERRPPRPGRSGEGYPRGPITGGTRRALVLNHSLCPRAEESGRTVRGSRRWPLCTCKHGLSHWPLSHGAEDGLQGLSREQLLRLSSHIPPSSLRTRSTLVHLHSTGRSCKELNSGTKKKELS